MRHRSQNEEDDAGQAKDHADKPKSTPFREGGNRRNGNGDLEHRDAARENLVPVKTGLRLRLLVLGFALNLSLFLLILRRLFLVPVRRFGGQGRLRFQDRGLDALGLVVTLLIGYLDLAHHRFVGMHSGEKPGNCGEDSEDRRAQRHP